MNLGTEISALDIPIASTWRASRDESRPKALTICYICIWRRTNISYLKKGPSWATKYIEEHLKSAQAAHHIETCTSACYKKRGKMICL